MVDRARILPRDVYGDVYTLRGGQIIKALSGGQSFENTVEVLELYQRLGVMLSGLFLLLVG